MKLSDLIIEASKIGASQTPEGRMERFSFLLDRLLAFTPGNLIEVGAGAGMTTKILLEAAKKYDRKVLVIDPFEDGWKSIPSTYGEPYPFKKFLHNVKDYDNLVLCKHESLSYQAVDAIRELLPCAFVFLDGLQFRDNVYNELNMMAMRNASVICVDDANRLTNESQVPLALEAFLCGDDIDNSEYHLVKTNLIEAYLIKT